MVILLRFLDTVGSDLEAKLFDRYWLSLVSLRHHTVLKKHLKFKFNYNLAFY